MKSLVAPMGEFSLQLNVDPSLYKDFGNIEIDPDQLAEVASTMGAVEAIDRRITRNPHLSPDLVVNCVSGQEETFHRKLALGYYWYSRAERKKRAMPAADLELFPQAIAKTTLPADIEPSNDEVVAQIESTIRHEIAHFSDPAMDLFYVPRSRRGRRKAIRDFERKQKRLVIPTTELSEKKELLKAKSSKNRLFSRIKIFGDEILGDAFEEASDKILGIPLCTPETSLRGLKRAIEFLEAYYLLPCEIYAREEAERYKDLGGFCCLDLKPESLKCRQPQGFTSQALY